MTTTEILSECSATFNFKNGKVEVFSVPTQHFTTDTIDEAVNTIIKVSETTGYNHSLLSEFARRGEEYMNNMNEDEWHEFTLFLKNFTKLLEEHRAKEIERIKNYCKENNYHYGGEILD